MQLPKINYAMNVDPGTDSARLHRYPPKYETERSCRPYGEKQTGFWAYFSSKEYAFRCASRLGLAYSDCRRCRP